MSARHFYCEDAARAGLHDLAKCCGSCHDEWEGGYSDPSTSWPENKEGKPGNAGIFGEWTLFRCCTIKLPGDGRQAFARMFWARRRA